MSKGSPWFTLDDLAEVMPDFPAAADGLSLITARVGDIWICGEHKIATVERAHGPDIARMIGGLMAEAVEDLAKPLAPAYVDAAVLRWQALTGLEATLEADGRSFAAVQADRLADMVGDDAAWA